MELALQRIREAKNTRAKSLDLGNCGLTELPDELFELTWLEELNLAGDIYYMDFQKNEWIDYKTKNQGELNKITNLSLKIANLSRLQILLISGDWQNKLDFCDLTPIYSLQNLKSICISHTKVKDLKAIESLKNLGYIDASYTDVEDLTPLIWRE